MHAKLAWIAVVVAGTGAGAVSWWNMTRLSFENDPNGYLISQMVPVYEGLAFTDGVARSHIDEALGRADVLGVTPVEGDPGSFLLAPTEAIEQGSCAVWSDTVSEAQIRSLRAQAGELIYNRLVQGDPAVYIESRKQRGAVAHDESELTARGWGGFDVLFPYYAGREPVEGDSIETLITETFDDWKTRTKVKGLRAIAAPGDGLVICLGMIDPTRASSSEILLSTALGLDGWSGSAPATGGTFLFPEQIPGEMLERYGALPHARVGVVLDYKGAPPQATVSEFIWNPELGDWQYTATLFINRKGMDGTNLPHF